MKKLSIMLAALSILSMSAICPANPISDTTTTVAEASTVSMVSVKADVALVKRKADEDSQTLLVVRHGQTFRYLSSRKGWTYIKFKKNGKTDYGYIKSSQVYNYTEYR